MGEIEEVFGAALVAFREAAGLSQSEMARRVKSIAGKSRAVYQQNITNWERATGTVRLPDPSDVFAIEQVLGVEPGALSSNLGYVPVGGEVTVERAVMASSWTAQRKKIVLALLRELQK